MNPLSDQMYIGTIGEILVQLRLLEYGIQASPPIKDSGNDLIAIKGDIFKAIQVKTTKNDSFNLRGLENRNYHILALVKLAQNAQGYLLDQSVIYLLNKDEVEIKSNYRPNNDYLISNQRINDLF